MLRHQAQSPGCGVLVVALALAAGLPVAHGREGPSPAVTALRGQVVDALSKQPLAGAVVTVRRRPSLSISAISDASGRFVVSELPTGRFEISVSKAGYLPGAFGQLTPGGSSVPLDIGPSTDVPTIVLRLWPNAVIAGRVTDEQQQPIVGAAVVALVWDHGYEPPRLIRARARVARTDDRGEYRLSDLGPGSYLVAVPSDSVVFQYGSKPATGESRPTTFFPGVPTAAVAAPVDLGAGQVRQGVDIAVVPEPAREVFGLLEGAWRLSNLTVELTSLSDTVPTDLDTRAARLGGDRSFSFGRVPYGRYLFRAVSFPAWGNYSKIGGFANIIALRDHPLPATSDEPTHAAETIVEIDDRGPVGQLTLPVAIAGRFRGRVVFDGRRQRPSVERLQSTPIVTEPADGRNIQRLPTARIEADGTFRTVGLPSGRYALGFWFPIEGWHVRSVSAGGRQLDDRCLTIGTTDVSDVVVTMTDSLSTLSGTVRDRSGRIVAGGSVFLVPTDRSKWRDWAVCNDRLYHVRSDSEGVYVISNIIPGEYYLAGSVEAAPVVWQQSEWLDRMSSLAIRVRVDVGSDRLQDLTARR